MSRGPRRGLRAARPTARPLKQRVRTAKGRTVASTRWLERQLNDPYVAEARRRGFRSRAAFKLIELNDRFHILKPGLRVVDLGAAPGGWTQVAAEAVGAGEGGAVVAVDMSPMDPVAGAIVIEGDAREEPVEAHLRTALGGAADVVLSDMAPPSTGHVATDHLRIVALCETAWSLTRGLLAPGGCFVAKVLQGGTEGAILVELKRQFATVRHAKPPSSRAESSEFYVVAQGFRATAITR